MTLEEFTLKGVKRNCQNVDGGAESCRSTPRVMWAGGARRPVKQRPEIKIRLVEVQEHGPHLSPVYKYSPCSHECVRVSSTTRRLCHKGEKKMYHINWLLLFGISFTDVELYLEKYHPRISMAQPAALFPIYHSIISMNWSERHRNYFSNDMFTGHLLHLLFTATAACRSSSARWSWVGVFRAEDLA